MQNPIECKKCHHTVDVSEENIRVEGEFGRETERCWIKLICPECNEEVGFMSISAEDLTEP